MLDSQRTWVCRRHQVDMYSMGVLLWEIATCERPQRGQLRDLMVPHEAPAELQVPLVLMGMCVPVEAMQASWPQEALKPAAGACSDPQCGLAIERCRYWWMSACLWTQRADQRRCRFSAASSGQRRQRSPCSPPASERQQNQSHHFGVACVVGRVI